MIMTWVGMADPGSSEGVLHILFGVFLGISALVVIVSGGKHPFENRLAKYSLDHSTEDIEVGIRGLRLLRTHIEAREYQSARDVLRLHSNWFYYHRHYLPMPVVDAWLLIRARVNRMLSLETRDTPEILREVEAMHQFALKKCADATAVMESFLQETAYAGYEARTMSAPSARNLSSIRS